MEETVRTEIAEALDLLAAQEVWNEQVWRRCYDLVTRNITEDPLLVYVQDDLTHYSGRRLFRSAPVADFNRYRQEFRDIATALRSRMSLTEYKKAYE